MKSLFQSVLSRLFPKTSKNRKPLPNRRAHLSLETLEDRLVPSSSVVTNPSNGPVLTHVQVENIFYGQGWTSQANQVDAGQLNTYMKTIVGSSYMSMLGEYGVGTGRFLGSATVANSQSPAAGTTVTESQIQQTLMNEINQGLVPAETGAQLYFVYLPPNVVSPFDQQNGSAGHHNSFTANVGPLQLVGYKDMTASNPKGIPIYSRPLENVYYAVITNPTGGLGPSDWASPATFNGQHISDFQAQTEVSSHELAEAVTDPSLGSWRAFTNTTPGNSWEQGIRQFIGLGSTSSKEIGDLESWHMANFDGYLVQKIYSDYFTPFVSDSNGGIVPRNDNPNPTFRSAPTVAASFHGETLWEGVGKDGNTYYQWTLPAGVSADPNLGWFTLAS